jgi:hypothetical protein
LLPWLYRLWNAGVQLPLVGASGKDSNQVVLGALRTYAYVEAGETWIDAVRNGRTIASTGPLLELQREGDRLRSWRRSGAEGVELINDGEVIATGGEGGEPLDAPCPATGWVAARSRGASGFVHTSPLSPVGAERDSSAVAVFVQLVEQTRDWVRNHGRYNSIKRRDELLARCAEAVARLESRP